MCCGPGRLVSIATGYGLENLGIESRWRRDIPHLSRPALGPPSLLYKGYRVFPGGKKRLGRDADPSAPSSAVGHERVQPYLYSRYGPYGLYRASVPVQGCTLPFFFYCALYPDNRIVWPRMRWRDGALAQQDCGEHSDVTCGYCNSRILLPET